MTERQKIRIRELTHEIERLQNLVKDRDGAYFATLNSDCPDEMHCTCVPYLKARIAILENSNAVGRAITKIRDLEAQLTDARSYVAEVAAGITHYPHAEGEPCVRCERDEARDVAVECYDAITVPDEAVRMWEKYPWLEGDDE